MVWSIKQEGRNNNTGKFCGLWAVPALGLFLVFFLTTIWSAAFAQAPATKDTTVAQGSHLRISLITCTPGEEVWETFGHTCLRVIDSTKQGGERDVIYNYGFFEATEDNGIMSQFLSGRVKVMLDTITYDELMYEYTVKKRGVVEQVFLLDNEQKARVLAFLKNNMRRENRYYDYDTFYDNCTTRVLDLFRKVFGGSFVAGQVLPPNSKLTFRDVSVNWYCPLEHKYWFGLGLNLLYASTTDKVMSNTESMFLASYLSDGMATATINGKKICADKKTILEDSVTWPSDPNWPGIIFFIIAVIVVTALMYSRQHALGSLISTIILLSTGLAGLAMLYLWHIQGEPAWRSNFNVLWALPTNIIAPFLGKKIKAKYALFALGCLGLSFLLHLFNVQRMPLDYIGWLLFALLWIYGTMYKNAIKSIS